MLNLKVNLPFISNFIAIFTIRKALIKYLYYFPFVWLGIFYLTKKQRALKYANKGKNKDKMKENIIFCCFSEKKVFYAIFIVQNSYFIKISYLT